MTYRPMSDTRSSARRQRLAVRRATRATLPAMAVIVPTLRYERRLWNEGLSRVVGVDEVGVAPTCGAVVAAAVIMDSRVPPHRRRP